MRKEDTVEKTHFRSEKRMFQINGDWYFATRDKDQGPYVSDTDAESGLAMYLMDLRGELGLSESSSLNKNNRQSVWDLYAK